MGPSPVPQRVRVSPFLAGPARRKERSWTRLLMLYLTSVTTPGPLPPEFNAKAPKELCTTVTGAGWLVCPLKVTVICPVPTGAFEGIMAFTCAAEVYATMQLTVAPPTVNWTVVPASPCVVGNG